MLRLACGFLLPALLVTSSAARAGPRVLPARTRDRIDAVMKNHVPPGGPGCSLGVMQHGELVFSRGYGFADLEHQVPIRADTVFDIASVSKQFTAMAILLLAQDGKLTLDDDVRKHIPELPPYAASITLRHLLSH